MIPKYERVTLTHKKHGWKLEHVVRTTTEEERELKEPALEITAEFWDYAVFSHHATRLPCVCWARLAAIAVRNDDEAYLSRPRW